AVQPDLGHRAAPDAARQYPDAGWTGRTGGLPAESESDRRRVAARNGVHPASTRKLQDRRWPRCPAMSVDATRLRGLTIRQIEPADFVPVREHILRVVRDELLLDYRPEWHWDLDDLQGVYVDRPRQALFVAVDDLTGEIAGTTS